LPNSYGMVSTPLDVEWSLVAVLAATKAADAVTTFVGLRFGPALREGNPVAADAMAAVGVPAALLLLGAAAVVAVTAVTEAGVVAVARADASPRARTAVRLAGYGLASVLHVVVAARNAALLVVA